MKNIIHTSAFLILLVCNHSLAQGVGSNFHNYWYSGEAEITSYALEQVRYGEIHQGEAVMVFVTEPFSKSKQVKLDDWREQGTDNVNVMKLNMTKKFLTGIYPYSMMMSTFTPVSSDKYPNVIKVTTSSQEWCGHTWMQLNLRERDYRFRGFSYFESEGDEEKNLPKGILEDELWTRIRLNPQSLPAGEVKILPSTFYLRLRHRNNEPQMANVKLESIASSDFSSQSHQKYSIEYADRSLMIFFEKDFPHTILGWEETHLSGFGNPKKLTTRAKRINTIKTPYWSKNSNADRAIRKKLGLRTE